MNDPLNLQDVDHLIEELETQFEVVQSVMPITALSDGGCTYGCTGGTCTGGCTGRLCPRTPNGG